jgi:hypothetical protein
MRVIVPLIALLFTTGAAAPTAVIAPMPAPDSPIRLQAAPDGATAVCRDQIQQVRRELGKPALDREVSPQQPLFIAAVDKRIGGCEVMVMRDDTSDFRPLPAPGEARLMPAR